MDSIKNIISHVMGQMNAASHEEGGNIQTVWKKVAGADGSRVADFKEGCLTVYTDNAMRMVKLHLNRQDLLERLRQEMPTVKKICFKVGPV